MTEQSITPREIKFRAWNTELEKFFYSYYEDDINDGREYYPFAFGIGFKGNHHLKMILQQFTGLKDKNGKEIYDGDIAKTDLGHIVEIVWDFCSEKTEDWDFEYTGFCMHNHRLKRNFHLDKGHTLTVIGNIFQSELISSPLNQ